MDLLVLLYGSKDRIIRNNNLDIEKLHIVKLDEKLLAKPKKVMSILKADKYNSIYFGTIELSLQRFQTFILLYLFLASANHKAIIDEEGARLDFSLVKILFKDIPLFIIEIIFSLIVVIYFYLKLPFIKKVKGAK